MENETRRSFVRKTTLVPALTAGAFLNLNPRARGANEKVVLALVGGRNQGGDDAVRAIQQGAEIKTFCDIDQAILDKINPKLEKAQNKAPGTTKEFRTVLDDKDIDGLIIATPDHWHARLTMLACQAGKDVYIEKPLSHTIHEGQLMRDAARKHKRVVQVGTQMRSIPHYATAIDYVKSGKLGKICEIAVWHCQVRESIGNPPDSDPPSTVDYDVWLGPAPKKPFNKNRFHYNWRFFWDYCNSELGNQGVHLLDIAMWGIQSLRSVDNCLPTHVSGNSGIYWLHDAKEVPDTQMIIYDYGDFMLTWELRSFARHNPPYGAREAMGFHGSDASLIVDSKGWRVYPKSGGNGPAENSPGILHDGRHERNFVDCIKSRKAPNADVELGRLSTTICHLGNICTRLGRDIRFDPKTETFGADKKANAFLTKEYRKGYELPKV
jgi:predicted dehydrogenase